VTGRKGWLRRRLKQRSTPAGLLGSPEPVRTLTINVDGIDLFRARFSDPAAHLVLFLHGFPEYSGAWDELLPALAQGYHAVAPEQRG
jgi:alpha-beta hydrolase superfamily lysophospholipase